jgi:glycerol-3-phosphate O-acyltransferase
MTKLQNQPAGTLHTKWRACIQKMLQGTHNHFFFELPERTGLIPWLQTRFFNDVTINAEQLEMVRQLPKESVIVYTIKFKSYFEYLFYHCRYRQEKLRVPELGFGFQLALFQRVSKIFRCTLAHLDWFLTHWRCMDPYANGYWRDELLKGRAAILPLVEKHGFYRRFVKSQTDPLVFLIELQQTTDKPVYLIPHLMFYSKSPATSIPRLRDLFLGSQQHPGLLRRIVTFIRHPKKVFVEISQPIDLRLCLDPTGAQESNLEYQALRLRHRLLVQHDRHRQSITGPVIKSHEEIKESILASDRLRKVMAQHAKSRKKPLHAVRKQADGFLDEIAAKYSFFFISLISRPVGWLLNTMFDCTTVDTKGLQRAKAMSQKAPLVLVPCHKSHIDYLLLAFMLFQNNLPCPHVAAGKNLSFWPLGPVFRAGGAFFIRRTFRGAVLYSKVFAEYIFKLLEGGFNLEIFIEGGRSRTGKLLMPKLGFLTILLNAFKNGACEDLIFVPVYIGYDQILEENAYLLEVGGGQKEPENLSQIFKARRYLKQRFGKIYINFNDPVSLNELLKEYDEPLTDMPPKTQNALCRDLGWRMINAINQAGIVTPHALVAAAMLNCPAKRFNAQELFEVIDTYIHLLFSQQAKIADTLLIEHQQACQQAIDSYVQRKCVEIPSGEKGLPEELAQYFLPDSKRLQLEYYKNNCIAFFVPAAILALSILEKDAFQFSAIDLHDRYRYLQSFFKYEFAYDVTRSTEVLVRKTLKTFIDDAILMPHPSLPDTYQITSSGLRKLQLFARFLKTYLESYRVVLAFLKQTPRSKTRGKDRMKKMHAIGRTMLKGEQIQLPESLSNINFENGISLFTFRNIKGSEDDELIQSYKKTIHNFLQLI